MRIFGKENNEPEMPAQVQGRRPQSTSHSFPPQVFYDPGFNPLYNPLNSYYNRTLEYDYSSNYGESSSSANPFASDFNGDFKPLSSTPRRQNQPSQPRYGAGPSNTSGSSINFGM
jgi:hypothetical protein